MKGWSDVLFSLHSDGVHRGGHPVFPVGLTDGQPAELSSERLVDIISIIFKTQLRTLVFGAIAPVTCGVGRAV